MRTRLTSLIQSHGGTLVPPGIVAPFDQQGTTALTMRYGSETIQEYGEKASATYTLTASRLDLDSDPVYYGLVETPESYTDVGFLFHTVATDICTKAELDAAVAAFALDLVDATNTETSKWFVTPELRCVREAFADYPYDLHPTTQPRETTLHAPATGAEFIRPSNLCMGDLRFVAALRAVEEGDVLVETDASPDDVLADSWFDCATSGVDESVELDVREREDGGTQFVVTATT